MMGTVHMTEATDCHPWQPERGDVGIWGSGAPGGDTRCQLTAPKLNARRTLTRPLDF